MELFDIGSSACCGSNLLYTDNLNGVSTSTMTGSHVTVTLGNSSSSGQITVFPVHVVCTTPGVISQPNTKVLDFQWFPFIHQLATYNLSLRLLDLPQLLGKIPEARLCSDFIWGEDPHAVQRRVLV